MKKLLLTPFLFFFAVAMKSEAQWNLTGNANATTTSIPGTTNAIPLNLSTNNIQRLVIDANGKVGIGIAAPPNVFSVKGSGGVPSAVWTNAGAPLFTGFGEQTVGNADYILSIASSLANARPVFIGRRARGTLAAPTVVSNNDQIMSFLSSGYDGSAFQNPAAIDFFIDGTPTAGNVPARISFVTGTNGSNRAERLKIGNTGDITMNTNQLTIKKATGYVGIGTATPAAVLDVNGSANFLGAFTINGYTFPLADGTANDVLSTNGRGTVSWTSLSGYARTDLSNLVPTYINQSLNPITDYTFDLGNVATAWKGIYANEAYYLGGSKLIETPGTDNIFIGKTGNTTNTSVDNIFIGNNAGNSNGVGYQNLFVGNYAGYANNNGSNNTMTGWYAGKMNSSGSENLFAGSAAGVNNVNGSRNTFVGAFSGNRNMAAADNTFLGNSAGYYNESGTDNCYVGSQAGYNNIAGTGNAFLGSHAGFNCKSNNNVAIGREALFTATTTSQNIAIGYQALYSATAGNNVAIGYAALTASTGGAYNTANGFSTLISNTSGFGNSAFGSSSLGTNTTGTYNTALGYGADVSANNLTNATAIGNSATVDASNKVRVGNINVSSIGGQVTWTSFSDGRIKQDIRENVPGLSFINLLRPVTYHFNLAKEYELMGRKDTMQWQGKNDIEKMNFTGFVAQDVDAAAKKIDYDFSGVDKSGKIMGLRYAEFVVPLVKAVQELSKKNEELGMKNEELKANATNQKKVNEELKKDIADLKAMIMKLMNNPAAPCPPMAGK